jgi:hypothetical protein
MALFDAVYVCTNAQTKVFAAFFQSLQWVRSTLAVKSFAAFFKGGDGCAAPSPLKVLPRFFKSAHESNAVGRWSPRARGEISFSAFFFLPSSKKRLRFLAELCEACFHFAPTTSKEKAGNKSCFILRLPCRCRRSLQNFRKKTAPGETGRGKRIFI